MEKSVWIIICFTFCFLSSFKEINQKHIVKTIVIDAGHGGKDPGACGKNSKEKDINLKIALKLGEKIRKDLSSIQIIYTRTKDEFVELYKRAEIANKNNANLFISIHCNNIQNHKRAHHVAGTEIYVMGLHTNPYNLKVAQKENQVISLEVNKEKHYGSFDPNSPESYILFSLYQNIYTKNSLLLAQKLDKQFKLDLKKNSLGIKQAGFLVLWKTYCPSILVEAGFLSNLEEEKYLLSSKGQKEIAVAIFEAIKAYKKEIEAY